MEGNIKKGIKKAIIREREQYKNKVIVTKRFKFLLMLLLIFFILMICYSRFIEPEMLVMKEITTETKMDIEKCRVVFFTDTHFGKLYDVRHIKRIVGMINKLEADIVIFGGDLFDDYERDRRLWILLI